MLCFGIRFNSPLHRDLTLALAANLVLTVASYFVTGALLASFGDSIPDRSSLLQMSGEDLTFSLYAERMFSPKTGSASNIWAAFFFLTVAAFEVLSLSLLLDCLLVAAEDWWPQLRKHRVATSTAATGALFLLSIPWVTSQSRRSVALFDTYLRTIPPVFLAFTYVRIFLRSTTPRGVPESRSRSKTLVLRSKLQGNLSPSNLLNYVAAIYWSRRCWPRLFMGDET